MNLTRKQKEVLVKLREGYFLYENMVTAGARWCLTKSKGSYTWGNVNGNVIDKLNKQNLINGRREHLGCFIWQLTELGKTIKL